MNLHSVEPAIIKRTPVAIYAGVVESVVIHTVFYHRTVVYTDSHLIVFDFLLAASAQKSNLTS